MLRLRCKKILIGVTVLYLAFTLYTVLSLFLQHLTEEETKGLTGPLPAIEEVQIWGKAAISLYLWEHIFEGVLNSVNEHMLRYGELTIDHLHFKFQNGPFVTTETVSNDVKHLIIILNGRSEEKVKFAKSWLEELNQFSKLKTVILIILGNEKCDNNWIQKYLTKNGGHVDIVFLVYDSQDVDSKTFFQWPLGVATYRGFERTDYNYNDAKRRRKYICNFLGTIYRNSSREVLLDILREKKLAAVCYTKPRSKWITSETRESRETYHRVLEQSDLTLCPIGINSESYRIYEAMSYGSVPVLEDIMSPGYCGGGIKGSAKAPFRLLKETGAPVIYVRDWVELRALVEREKRLSLTDKVKRRLKVMAWYRHFKSVQRNRLVRAVKHVIRMKMNKQ